ncbi:hypothetical protein [Corynebacterium glyciniphilum]|uniref:hypothetical protein n=1 Tax=Corynebacterium glyciniphilum TaxID=1404244 RepID=UPI00264EB9F8|nr:hypothetical protein [Corynebacterium glyciniphilum]MDN5683818.1 hypothetical protein [Corynebacterium glyciniphilum]MDN6705743.1 hypothetical protein [Corynebacterium glyciniphilum]
MPRRNRRQGSPERDMRRDGAAYLGTRREDAPSWAGGPSGWAESYLVRRIGSQSAVKYYVCPGCNQNIPPGLAHIVAWPDSHRGGDERRHWHTGCWERRRTGRR